MESTLNEIHRKPIWLTLSKLYLDTQLDNDDFKNIALTIYESNYTLKEVKKIDKFEVFPVLIPNILMTAGEWIGFDEDWLIEKIKNRIKNKSILKNKRVIVFYFIFKNLNTENWIQIENEYLELKIK